MQTNHLKWSICWFGTQIYIYLRAEMLFCKKKEKEKHLTQFYFLQYFKNVEGWFTCFLSNVLVLQLGATKGECFVCSSRFDSNKIKRKQEPPLFKKLGCHFHLIGLPAAVDVLRPSLHADLYFSSFSFFGHCCPCIYILII